MGFVLEPGSAIGGRYKLDKLLGMGGMGQVWSARHLVTGRGVAVKFLRERGLDTDAQARLLKEARASCAIKHRGIVPVLDVIESEAGEPALVMDLLEGESLARRLSRDGRLSAQDTVAILLPAAEALLAAHEAGIIHRDLKPDNVFLTDAGETKVLDFGIAKLIHVAADVARSAGTQTGAIVGTPMYMSPEQAFGERDIDERTDIWSLGLIFYECLTGVLPTAAENLGQVLKIILTSALRPLRELAPDTPEELAALVMRMLRRERAERPAQMSDVLDVLSKLAGSSPGPRAPVSARERPSVSKRINVDANTTGGHSSTQIALPAARRGGLLGALVALAALASVAGGVWWMAERSAAPSASSAYASSTSSTAPEQSSSNAQPVAASSSAVPLPASALAAADVSARVEPSAGAHLPTSARRSPAASARSAAASVTATASVAPGPKSHLQGAVANDAPF